MRKLTCIFQCCLWPSSSNCPPRLQPDPPRRFGLERFVRSGHSGWTLAGALTHPHSLPLTAKSRGGRRPSGPPPEVPLGPARARDGLPAKLASSPHVATRPALKSKARKEEEKSLTFLGLNKSLEQGLNLSRS